MRDDKKYDVVIVGAGPAGLKCAETLKNSGKTVLLLEKNKTIGPKVCAGGLTSFKKQLDLPEDITKDFKKISYYISGKEYEINLTRHISTIDRAELGRVMLSKIKNCETIDILTDTTVIKVDKDRITTSKGDFSFNYLVGADGANSIVRKFLGLKTKYLFGLVYKIPQVTDKLKIFFDKDKIKGGYIWIFPHKNYNKKGIYFDLNEISPVEAKKVLEALLEENDMDYSNSKREGYPLSVLYKGCIFGNIYLVGEAAGMTFKASGEGIRSAIVSASDIAKKIIDPKYKLKELNKVLRIKKSQDRLKFLADFLFPLRNLFFRFAVFLMKRKKFEDYFV